MRIVPIVKLRADSKLALDVFNEAGQLVLAKNTILNQSNLSELKKAKISSVYITDQYCYCDTPTKYMANSDHMMSKISILKKMIANVALGVSNNETLISAIELVNEIVQYYYSNQNNLELVYEDAKIEGNVMEEKIICVAMISTLFALKLGLKPRAAAAVCLAALLKDVALVTPSIKWINGETNKHHPKKAYEYLKQNYNLPDDVLNIILAHEELYDGSGYPNQLKGEAIPTGARIITIIETYYNSKMNFRDNCLQLESDFVKKTYTLDPGYLEVFRENTNVYEPNTLVELTTGDIAVVINKPSLNSFQPNIQIIRSKSYDVGSELCLAKVFNVNIQKIIYYID
ncbi:MAG: hypothetical protein ATN31_06425 [Candidatus Epulonipiscioides saccharophilum]|nr:MAG: hypothetical protein ATN31_06425 [Epulopiscium sp. AS2M-Bin001]